LVEYDANGTSDCCSNSRASSDDGRRIFHLRRDHVRVGSPNNSGRLLRSVEARRTPRRHERENRIRKEVKCHNAPLNLSLSLCDLDSISDEALICVCEVTRAKRATGVLCVRIPSVRRTLRLEHYCGSDCCRPQTVFVAFC